MFRFQSLDDDCTLEEEDDGLIEEEDEIDQFNDDTFGAGAIDDDWQEEHKRLAELDERVGLGGGDVEGELDSGGSKPLSSIHRPSSSVNPPLQSSLPPFGFSSSSPGLPPQDADDRAREGGLAESLARLILEADPAIAGVGAAERPRPSPSSSASSLSVLHSLDQPRVLPQSSSIPHQRQPPLPPGPITSGLPSSSMLTYQQQQQLLRRGAAPMGQMNSHNIWDNSMSFGPVSVSPGLVTHMEDSPLMSIIKEGGLPKRPQGRGDEGRDLSERVPPPRSSSPVIGSPPVRAVPIGTPPKQPMSHSLNHQVTVSPSRGVAMVIY
uniref:Protein associated with topoisomerase II homolog 1 n=1 Tax=Nothobranchius korthausae TaxID=1143690 RepID=A0A1A8FXK6_9TELE